MDCDSFYKKLMRIESIRYSVILSSTGEKICGGFQKSVVPILNDEEIKMMHFYAVQRWSTRKNVEHKLGTTKYAMAEYEKLKRISFPVDEKHLLMITVDTNTDHKKIIDDVLELIKELHV